MSVKNGMRLPGQITHQKFGRLQWDPALRERKTMTDYLAMALRAAIYDGQFADGEELNQVELAQFFGVSRVPIREALRQLQAEGLVRNIAHHRTVVVGLTLTQVLEMIEMRAVLEGHMLRKSAVAPFDKGVLAELGRICDETERLRDYGSKWVLKNWEFHRLLYGNQSQSMIETVERIQLNIERYARRSGTAERQKQAAQEHRAILNKIERKDYNKAATLLEHHILNTGEDIQRKWQQPDAPAREPEGRPKRTSAEGRPSR